jgi:hypothetical protein
VEGQRFRNQNNLDRQIHGVSRVPVKTANNQYPGGIDWKESAFPVKSKYPDAVEKHGYSDDSCDCCADTRDGKGKSINGCGLKENTPGDETNNGSGYHCSRDDRPAEESRVHVSPNESPLSPLRCVSLA